jgi:hypothetical protein
MKKVLLLVASALLVNTAVIFTVTSKPPKHGPIVNPPGTLELPPCDERRVETPDQLEQVLRSDFVGCVVVAKDKFLNMTGRSSIPIKSGVRLKGERGELGSRPSLFTDAKCADPSLSPGSAGCEGYSLFTVTGNNIAVTGVHMRGPANGSRSSDQPYVNAIEITADPDLKQGRGIYVGESEFNEWTGSGVEINSTRRARTPEQYLPEWARLTSEDAGLIRVERNFFHHNAREGGGYGVNVSTGAFATIMGNVFDFNRHAVASNGFAHTGYIARFNYALEGGFKQGSYYNQHFDVHGANDTNGDDKSTGYGGTAGEYYEVAYNAVRGAQKYYCFIICLRTRPALLLRGKPTTGMRFDANVAVHDDFGEFDAQKGTDVAAITGGKWQISSGSTGSWTALNALRRSSFRGAVVADFNGDGRSDIAFDDGRQMWNYSPGGAAPLQALREGDGQLGAYPELGGLLVGHFDGDPRVEVVSYYVASGVSPDLTNHFMIWRGGRRDRFEQLSRYAMR